MLDLERLGGVCGNGVTVWMNSRQYIVGEILLAGKVEIATLAVRKVRLV